MTSKKSILLLTCLLLSVPRQSLALDKKLLCGELFDAVQLEKIHGLLRSDGLFMKVKQGEEIHKESSTENLFSDQEFQTYRIFKLGAGLWGGSVFRLIPKDGGSPRVIKIYKERKQLEEDMKSLSLMKIALNGEKNIRVSNKFEDLGGLRMELEDVQGVSFDEVMTNNHLSGEIRDLLWNYYLELFNVIKKNLEAKYGTNVKFSNYARFPWYQAYVYNSGTLESWIYFKHDNIILRANDLEMVVTDGN